LKTRGWNLYKKKTPTARSRQSGSRAFRRTGVRRRLVSHAIFRGSGKCPPRCAHSWIGLAHDGFPSMFRGIRPLVRLMRET